MKRLFTGIICVLSLQFAVAASPALPSKTPANAAPHLTRFIPADTIILPAVNQPAPLTSQSSIFKRRLDSLEKDVPLDYNEYVQSYIDIYARNRDEMGQVLGLTKYYFPIYEKVFHDAGIPEEIKYLSIVESKLDPYAVSRVGATGLWQFMFTTAKLYGLNMDNYVDDRRDPVQASYAAAAYLKDAYQEFGDWLLAIASYNCGKSNVERAIEKAGANDFWSIRQYLPSETRGYVPAFIAVTYLMNYPKYHNIVPQSTTIAMKTDTVVVNKYVALSAVAAALDINLKDLTILNPAYKKQIVNGTNNAPRRLIIPQIEKAKFAALYDALNKSDVVAYRPQPELASYRSRAPEKHASFHKVKRGETLSDIADRYGVEVQDLKVWNHLRSNKAIVGQVLKVDGSAAQEEKPAAKRTRTYTTYKVKHGDTLYSISEKFNASVEQIKALNGLKKNHLQPGMTIKVKG